jgi:homoserine kinase
VSQRARAFAPATVGNVGPGFDVLGMCVDGVGDHVTVELVDAAQDVVTVTGRDGALIPLDPDRNAAVVAARSVLRRVGSGKHLRVAVEKGLPMSGGMGGSAASSVAGALATSLALDARLDASALMVCALAGERAVAGNHLDNIAPCVMGGVTLVRQTEPPDVIAVPVAVPLFVALVTPAVRVETRAARAILPLDSPRAEWVAQMANTAALVVAFGTGDLALLSRALEDRYAEPRRASLIPQFREAKAAALGAGALGCSISGSGPTVFALASTQHHAEQCAAAMVAAFSAVAATSHVGRLSPQGARAA